MPQILLRMNGSQFRLEARNKEGTVYILVFVKRAVGLLVRDYSRDKGTAYVLQALSYMV